MRIYNLVAKIGFDKATNEPFIVCSSLLLSPTYSVYPHHLHWVLNTATLTLPRDLDEDLEPGVEALHLAVEPTPAVRVPYAHAFPDFPYLNCK